MFFCHSGIPATRPYAVETSFCLSEDPGDCIVAESPAAYKPRHPERTEFYKLFETHFDCYVHAYEERFEPRSGPLRPVVVRSVEDFLGCGRLEGGFARVRCPKCHAEHLVAFSCRTRNFCSSCQAKRAVLFAEKLTTEILAPVPHRHWTFSIPRVLRGLVERDRRLLGMLSQTAYAAILKTFQALFDRTDVRPPAVSSLCRPTVPMGRTSIRTPMPWFPMACLQPKESSCARHRRSYGGVPPLAAESACAKPNVSPRALCGTCSHGCIRASQSSPDRPSKPPP